MFTSSVTVSRRICFLRGAGILLYSTIYSYHCRPQTKLRQGNVFTTVCDSVCKGGVSVQEGLYLGGSLSRGVSVQGVSVQGSLSRGSLSSGFYVRETPRRRTVTCGQYASYWNAFLLIHKPYQSVINKALALHYVRFGFILKGFKIHGICG